MRPLLALRLPVLTAVVILALALAGCGGDDGPLTRARDYAKGSGSAIASDARKAMQGLDAMHVAGQVSQGGNTVSVDLSVSGKGECSGTIGVGAGSIELRSVGGRAWYRADAAFWKVEAPDQAAEIARKVNGRWVPLAGELASLRTFCSIDAITEQMLSTQATVHTGGAVMVGSTPTVRLLVDRAGTSTSAYVLSATPHYVVRMTRGTHDELTFSDFDKAFTVKAPDPKDVFDLNNLE